MASETSPVSSLRRFVVATAIVGMFCGSMVSDREAVAQIRVRKNYQDLTAAQRQTFRDGLKALKDQAVGTCTEGKMGACANDAACAGDGVCKGTTTGHCIAGKKGPCTEDAECDTDPGNGVCRTCTYKNTYDKYLCWHFDCGCTGTESEHGRAQIIPWHRELIRRFELELRALGGQFADLTVPYWVWTEKFPNDLLNAGDNDFLGSTSDGFFFDATKWITQDGGKLPVRTHASAVTAFQQADILAALTKTPYDSTTCTGKCTAGRVGFPCTVDANCDKNVLGDGTCAGVNLGRACSVNTDCDSATGSNDGICGAMCRAADGNLVFPPKPCSGNTDCDLNEVCDQSAKWIDKFEVNGFRPTIERLHDTMHGWVGGDMLEERTAPDDPIFWLAHTYMDCLWSTWQALHPAAAPYRPDSAGTAKDKFPDAPTSIGDDVDTVMEPWHDKKIKDVTDAGNIEGVGVGYAYAACVPSPTPTLTPTPTPTPKRECTFDTNGDGSPDLILTDSDGDGLCEWPQGTTIIPGTLTFTADTPVEFSGTTSVSADRIVVEAGSLLKGDAASLVKLTLVARSQTVGDIVSNGTLDISASDDIILQSRESIDLSEGVTNLHAGDKLVLKAVRGNVTVAPGIFDPSGRFTLFARNRVEIDAHGPVGSIDIARARIGSYRIIVNTKASVSVVGEKHLRLSDRTILTTDADQVGIPNSSNIDLSATGRISLTDDTTLDSGRKISIQTKRVGDDVCLTQSTRLEAANGFGRISFVSVKGVVRDDGTTTFAGVIVGGDRIVVSSCP